MTDWLPHNGKPMPAYAKAGDLVYVRFQDGTETTEPQSVLSFGSAWWRGSNETIKEYRKNGRP